MNWQLDISVLIELATIAAIAGIAWQRMGNIETNLDKLEKEIIDNRQLHTDLAIMKTQLSSINRTLEKMTTLIERFEKSYEEDSE